MTPEQKASGMAHGNNLIALEAGRNKLELLAEVERLQGLVAALWRAGEEVLAERDTARARAAVLEGVRDTLNEEVTDWMADADKARAERAAMLEQLGHVQAHAGQLLERARAAEAVLEQLPSVAVWSALDDGHVLALSLTLRVLRRAEALLGARGTGRVPGDGEGGR